MQWLPQVCQGHFSNRQVFHTLKTWRLTGFSYFPPGIKLIPPLCITIVITHASHSWFVGEVISRVCDCVCVYLFRCVRAMKGKQLELSTQNLVHIYSTAGPWHAWALKSKGQGRRAMKCAADVGVHVDMTAWVSTLCPRKNCTPRQCAVELPSLNAS